MADKGGERAFLDETAARLGWALAHVAPRESPDFELLLANGTIVGLEVGRLADEAYAEGQPAVERLCADLEARLTALGLRLRVHVSFFESCTALVATTAVRQAHVDGILSVIESRLPLPETGLIEVDEDELEAAGARFVAGVLLWAGDSVAITTGHHGMIPGQELLRRTLRQKDAKLASYRAGLPAASEFWLLLVANGDVGGPFAAESVQSSEHTTSFDRVFCLDLSGRVQAFEVPTVRGV